MTPRVVNIPAIDDGGDVLDILVEVLGQFRYMK